MDIFFLSLFLYAAPSFSQCVGGEGLEILSEFDFSWENEELIRADELCSVDSAPRKVAKAFLALKQMPPLESASPVFKRDFVGSVPYRFLTERVGRFRFDREGRSRGCQDQGTVAFVSDASSKTIHICPMVLGLSDLALQSNLLHEAQHLKGPEAEEVRTPRHPHVLCERGMAKNRYACDSNYDAGGAYALQTEFLLKVAKTSRLSDLLRKEAYGLALSYLLYHFNQLPVKLNEGILLEDYAGGIQFFSIESKTMTKLFNKDLENIVSLRGLPVEFFSDQGLVKSFVGKSIRINTPGSFAELYRNLPRKNRKKLRDVYFGGTQACMLFDDGVYCEIGDVVQTVVFPRDFSPLHFSVLRIYGGDAVFVISQTGQFMALPLQNGSGLDSFGKSPEPWSFQSLQENLKFRGLRSVEMLSTMSNFALTLDGELVSFTQLQNFTPVKEAAHLRFQKILGEFRWSPELMKLD